MGPERKLYQKVKNNFKDISLIRLENNSLHGTPDLLGYNNGRGPWSKVRETFSWFTHHGA
jgi:hypothetical protein